VLEIGAVEVEAVGDEAQGSAGAQHRPRRGPGLQCPGREFGGEGTDHRLGFGEMRPAFAAVGGQILQGGGKPCKEALDGSRDIVGQGGVGSDLCQAAELDRRGGSAQRAAEEILVALAIESKAWKALISAAPRRGKSVPRATAGRMTPIERCRLSSRCGCAVAGKTAMTARQITMPRTRATLPLM